MRTIVGVLSLLVVVAVIGIVAKKQLQAVGSAPSAETDAASAALAHQPLSPAQAQSLPKQVQQDVERALQQGAEARASDANQ
ncbi:MAG TPA: hypothetical protein VGQ91_14670 [Ideonella sp.]|jgi:hypothetical protein|nr:hypothetical protein [Ideonella sp.]